MMQKWFKLTEHSTDIHTEIRAGLTTFMTMAYILAVNPSILSQSGMAFEKVFAGTAIASAIACFIMGFLANLPFALSAGMGVNAMFAYTVCIGMGYSWRWALSAVFVEGIIFILLTLTNVREEIIRTIPPNMKKAIGAGVGLFIAYIGLKNSGLIVYNEDSLTVLSPSWYAGAPGLTVIGLIITGCLLARKVKGALLIGMILTTLIGIPLGITEYAGGVYLPSAPYFCEFAFGEIFVNGKSIADFLIIVFTFLYVDIFNTLGTLIACAGKSGIINEDGSIPRAKQALMADAVGTAAGAIVGTSTVTTYVESASGVSEGGKTGLTAITVGLLFLASLFLSPVFASIPGAATAPALIIVGVMMVTPVKDIDFDDFTEAIPAFMTMVIMLCSSSMADGIMMGILFYVVLKLLSGRRREIKGMTCAIAVMYLIKTIFDIIQF